jgi:AraC-like DNA-binding protein
MSLYTTPLQLGYFFSLLLWILFNIRGYKEQRLSDKLLGWIMFILAMELQDYTFGFAGINVLWDELNGFPRGVGLLFGPVVYFYFHAQVNRSFRLRKKDLWHFLPYVLYFSYEFVFFVQGTAAVERKQEANYNDVLSHIMLFTRFASYIFYFSKCLIIYKKYRIWSVNQFSNTELIDFSWFRNFIYAMIFWLVCREIMNIIDAFLALDFYQDWWWNLALVGVVFYIGLTGFSQRQPVKMEFESVDNKAPVEVASERLGKDSNDKEKVEIAERLKTLMERDRLYLQPDLNLYELSQYLQITSAQLSSAINQILNLNFNDYINGLRIEAFIRSYTEENNHRFTLLAIAFESGFNSKATFNRAFRKIKGCSPKEYFELHHPNKTKP